MLRINGIDAARVMPRAVPLAGESLRGSFILVPRGEDKAAFVVALRVQKEKYVQDTNRQAGPLSPAARTQHLGPEFDAA